MAKKRRKASAKSSSKGKGKGNDKGESLTLEAARTPDTKAPGRGTWRVMDRGSSVMAGLLATRASAIAWRTVTGRKPPTSGRHPEVSTREAVAWAVVGGSIVELVKVGVRRGAATYWVRSTGQLPPGMKPIVPGKGSGAKGPGTTKEPALAEPAPLTSDRKVSRRSRGR